MDCWVFWNGELRWDMKSGLVGLISADDTGERGTDKRYGRNRKIYARGVGRPL